jgi:uncharacterized protein YqeY
MSLEQKIMAAMKDAMKAKDQVSLRGLRAIKSAILLAKTEKGASGELTEDKEIALLQKLAKQRKESYDIFVEQGREDLAATEKEEIEVIEKFLPEQMSEVEVKTFLENLVQELGASSMKDMGKVMGAASSRLAGKADNKLVSQIVKDLLA